MNKFISKLGNFLLIAIFSFSLLIPTFVTKAQDGASTGLDDSVCAWVNAQSGSIGNATLSYGSAPTTSTDPKVIAEDKKKREENFQKEYDEAKKQQDERAKALDSRWANKIVVITEEPLGPNSSISWTCARVTTCSTGFFDLTSKVEVRRCFTNYQESSVCDDLFTDTSHYCEPVKIYIADGGTTLLYGYIGLVYRYVAMIGGFIAVLVLIMAGVMRAASGDNPGMVTKANELVTRCITGLVVLFLSALILYTINPNFFLLT